MTFKLGRTQFISYLTLRRWNFVITRKGSLFFVIDLWAHRINDKDEFYFSPNVWLFFSPLDINLNI